MVISTGLKILYSFLYRDKPIQVIIYIHGNEALCIAIINKQKCHFFYKNREQEGKTDPFWEVGISRRGRI
jgi:hypothetical protein